MKNTRKHLRFLVACSIFFLLFGCEDETPAPKPAATSAVVAPVPTPSATAAAAPKAENANERPSKVDTELTPARRTAVEGKYAAAKGFLAAPDLQAKLKADKSLKDKK